MRPVNTIREGDFFEREGERLLVVSVDTLQGVIVLQTAQSEKTETVFLSQLHEQAEAGELIYISRDTGLRVDAVAQAVADARLSEQSKGEYSFRLRVVKNVEHRLKEGVLALKAYEQSRWLKPEEEEGSVLTPSARTVRRWFAAYKRSGEIALIPQHAAKGRTQSEMSHEQDNAIQAVVTRLSDKPHLLMTDIHRQVNYLLQH